MKPYTLLLADDNVTTQRIIELTFADEDFVVVAVSDGHQAIARLESSPPDIVLADIAMPGMNGYEVAQYVRRSPHLSHIPVVLLTGAFEPVDQARAAESGCDGVLAKPFEPQLVIDRVKELLAGTNRPPPALAPDRPQRSVGPDEQLAPPAAELLVDAPLPKAAPAALNDYFDRLDAAFASLSADASATPPLPAAAAPPAATDIDWFSAAASDMSSTDGWDFASPTEPIEPPDLASREAMTLPAPFFPASAPPAGPGLAAFDEGAAPAAMVPAASLATSAQVAALADFAPDPVEVLAAAAPDANRDVVAPFPLPSGAGPPHMATPRPGDLPPLSDAFAALLAAEQQEPLPMSAPRWPGIAGPAAEGTGPRQAADTDALVEDVTRRVLERLSDQVVRETVAEIVSTIAERLVRDEIEKIKASLK